MEMLEALLCVLAGAWIYEWGRQGKPRWPSLPKQAPSEPAGGARLRFTPARFADPGEIPPRRVEEPKQQAEPLDDDEAAIQAFDEKLKLMNEHGTARRKRDLWEDM